MAPSTLCHSERSEFVILNEAKRSEESILKKGMKMDASLRSA
jgi:hypothetical protein